MKFNRNLAAIVLSTTFAACVPKPKTAVSVPLSIDEKQLLEDYDELGYGSPYDAKSFPSAFGDTNLNFYIDRKNGSSVYSMIAESKIARLLFIPAVKSKLEGYVADYYDVDRKEVRDVADYISSSSEDVNGIRVDVRYKVGEKKGALIIYDLSDKKDRLVASRLVSPELVLSAMHYCAVHFMKQDSINTFLDKDFGVVKYDRVRIVKR